MIIYLLRNNSNLNRNKVIKYSLVNDNRLNSCSDNININKRSL